MKVKHGKEDQQTVYYFGHKDLTLPMSCYILYRESLLQVVFGINIYYSEVFVVLFSQKICEILTSKHDLRSSKTKMYLS